MKNGNSQINTKAVETVSSKEEATISNPGSDQSLMDRICKYGRLNGQVSPLCNDWELYNDLKTISTDVGVDFGLMVGITYAESHIGVNFSPTMDCKYANNWSGMKNAFDRSRNYRSGCRLHQFDDIYHFRYDYARNLKRGYIDKNCKTASCIGKYWVRGDGVLDGKQSRINRVNLFR